jgi:hypothetical protein
MSNVRGLSSTKTVHVCCLSVAFRAATDLIEELLSESRYNSRTRPQADHSEKFCQSHFDSVLNLFRPKCSVYIRFLCFIRTLPLDVRLRDRWHFFIYDETLQCRAACKTSMPCRPTRPLVISRMQLLVSDLPIAVICQSHVFFALR